MILITLNTYLTSLLLGIMEVCATNQREEIARCMHIGNIAQTIVKQMRNAKSPRGVRGRRARPGNGEPKPFKTNGKQAFGLGRRNGDAPGTRFSDRRVVRTW